MTSTRLKGMKLFGKSTVFNNGYIEFDNDTITSLGSLDDTNHKDANEKVYEFPENYICIPGFIDVHTHGANGTDMMDGTLDSLNMLSKTLPKEGTTSFLTTSISQGKDLIEAALSNIRKHMKEVNEQNMTEILGVHLEGPFISREKSGVQSVDAIIEPDIDLFKKWQESSGNNIKLITLAPEKKDGIEFLKEIINMGIVVSIGHSNGTNNEIIKAIEAGATHVTHLFNGMRGIHQREPGVLGTALMHDQLVTEIIMDGVHVHPGMIKLASKLKGADKIIAITDSNRAKYLKDGVYDLGGNKVIVKNNEAKTPDGTLAGSVLKMNEAFRNILEFTDFTIEEAIKVTSTNAAKQLNIYNRKGELKEGKDADIVILDEKFNVVMTVCRGKVAYTNGQYM